MKYTKRSKTVYEPKKTAPRKERKTFDFLDAADKPKAIPEETKEEEPAKLSPEKLGEIAIANFEEFCESGVADYARLEQLVAEGHSKKELLVALFTKVFDKSADKVDKFAGFVADSQLTEALTDAVSEFMWALPDYESDWPRVDCQLAAILLELEGRGKMLIASVRFVKAGPFEEGEEPLTDIVVKLLCRILEQMLKEGTRDLEAIEAEVERMDLRKAFTDAKQFLLDPDDAGNVLREDEMDNGKAVQMLLGIQ